MSTEVTGETSPLLWKKKFPIFNFFFELQLSSSQQKALTTRAYNMRPLCEGTFGVHFCVHRINSNEKKNFF